MDFADDVGTGFDEDLGAVFMIEIIFFKIEVVGVDAGAHGAVEEDDALADEI